MAYADANTRPNTPSLLVSVGVNALLIGAIVFAAPDIEKLKPSVITELFPVKPEAVPDEVKPIEQPAASAEPRPFVLPKPVDATRSSQTEFVLPPGGGEIVGSDPGLILPKPLDPVPPLPVLTNARIDPRHVGALQPSYPPGMIREGRQGTVTVRVLVGTDGRVRQVSIVAAETPEFAAATEKQALRKWRFVPATRDGDPIESWREMTVRFEIP